MKKPLTLILCAGTRPNFVKIAPLYHEGVKRGHNIKILHTGQHYDPNLSDVFFDELGLPIPDINLNISSNLPREELIKEIADSSYQFFKHEVNDYVFVVGDVNSTLGCAMGAKKAHKKVIHVEAGLRSFDMDMPEEHNRIETDRIVDYKFVSEPDGIVNLKDVGLYSPSNTFLVGNIMIDSLVSNLEKIEKTKLPFKPFENEYVVVTLHRPSNVDNREKLENILKLLNELSKKLTVVFPMHPRTQRNIKEFGLDGVMRDILTTESLGYFEFMKLVKGCKFVLTDSGGIQEETSYFGIPCITMRSNTERPITVSQGTSYLVGEDIGLTRYLSNYLIRQKIELKPAYIDLWEGKTAERIYAILED